MAQNVFDATLDVNNNVKQNVFDWTHNNNLTTQLGRITPIFCDLLPAKSSFRVDPNFGMQFMPMVFPIQTSMRARIAFFRYPLRALWEDYTDFVGNFREGLEEPYVDINSQKKLDKMAATCSLGDYLGLPTTVVGNYGKKVSFGVTSFLGLIDDRRYSYDIADNFGVLAGTRGVFNADSLIKNLSLGLSISTSSMNVLDFPDTASVGVIPVAQGFTGTLPYEASLSIKDSVEFSIGDLISSIGTFSEYYSSVAYFPALNKAFDLLTTTRVVDGELYVKTSFTSDFMDYYHRYKTPVVIYNFLNIYDSIGSWISYEGSVRKWDVKFLVTSGISIQPSNGNQLSGAFAVTFDDYGAASLYDYVIDWDSTSPRDLVLDTSPYYNSLSANKDKQVKLSAYAFRAYEGIYNAYFRDNRNNPYYIDGKVQYNKWIPTLAGGKDDNIYELRYANWERDFLTTAVQSPQQGTAPLVGITTYTQTVSNEDGTTTELVKTALVDEDGKKFGLSYKTSEDGLEGVEYTELSDGTQVRQARNLYDLATSGISIADLRAVNAYQKFLELNMRKGYSYRDIMQGRFDVKVRYDALLMPEFFGGCTRDVETHSVTQTVDQAQGINPTYAEALGSQAGLSGVRGSANANIECFCDEESIIIGVMIISPSAVYTQLLPKHFTYRGLMDHFQPEFNNIGFQPILYKEVCPIQAYNDNPDSLTGTFGYNRPWYEYVQKYDQAHGLFRTDLSNFLMHRVFDQKPELAQSFLIIDPEQVTDVFAVTETTDKIYGQIRMNCTVKLPVSRVAIPRLD